MSVFNSLWLKQTDSFHFLIKNKQLRAEKKNNEGIKTQTQALRMRSNHVKSPLSATNNQSSHLSVSLLQNNNNNIVLAGKNQRHISSLRWIPPLGPCKDPLPLTAGRLIRPSLVSRLWVFQIISRMSHGTKPLFFPLATRTKPLRSHSLLTQIWGDETTLIINKLVTWHRPNIS